MIDRLAVLDPIFAECLRVGGPVMREFSRPHGFVGLLRIILEQQLSTRVAEALWGRLLTRLGGAVDPESLLACPADELRVCGFSRQKIAYARGLAEAVADGRLDLEGLRKLDDEEAVATLVELKGIGRWTAEIYLLSALGRPDIWPADDLAIQLGVQRLKGWAERPDRARLMAAAESWRPYRSDAARLIWHYYIATQNGARP